MATGAVASLPPAFFFQRLRWRLLRNSIRVVFQQSRARVLTIFLCSLLIWGSLFAVSLLGFRELKFRWAFPLDGSLMGLVFDVLFVSLSALLIFSTGIILYSSLFSSAETSFLLSSPLAPDQIFAYKFQGAVGFSSWAFILLASPVLIAYGIEVNDGAPWYFYAVLPLFFLGFVLLPGCMGAVFCLCLVRFIPRNRKQLVTLSIVLLVVAIAVWLSRRVPTIRQLLGSRDWVEQFLDEISLVRGPFVPAHWIADGLQSAARGELENMFFRLALVWANGLFFFVITAWLAAKLYREAFNRICSGSSLGQDSQGWPARVASIFTGRKAIRIAPRKGSAHNGGWLDRVFRRLLLFLDTPTQLLIVKDFRTFRRDPSQWAQVLIFLGLIILYFSNVKWFYEQEIGKPFQNGISLLNLVATSFLMCAYTGRFMFPMLSLEGRKFWILGLLPLKRECLVRGKFIFAALGCVVVGEFLVLFSNVMLQMPPEIIVIQALTMAVVALSLSGLSVGLGACLPNFRESDPSKIAVGFGGTLNLVAGLLVVVMVIGLMAGPSHLLMIARIADRVDRDVQPLIQWAGMLAGLAVGALATVLPLRAGSRAIAKMEF